MKVALSPMEFAKRARRLYSEKEAVVDGNFVSHMSNFLLVVINGQPHCRIWGSPMAIESLI